MSVSQNRKLYVAEGRQSAFARYLAACGQGSLRPLQCVTALSEAISRCFVKTRRKEALNFSSSAASRQRRWSETELTDDRVTQVKGVKRGVARHGAPQKIRRRVWIMHSLAVPRRWPSRLRCRPHWTVSLAAPNTVAGPIVRLPRAAPV